MNEDSFVLSSRNGVAPVLTAVSCQGRLDGVLFEMVLRQTYKNTSERVLEVVYTFPLPAQSVLLGFGSELNGERQDGAIVAKHAAERTYEAALAEGDAPVMLEGLPGGLHTANIGNLKPGDELVLEVRVAQTLVFEQGRLRLAIPATIAPRFGNPQAAGLQPQQVPVASLDAEYPLSVSITATGSLARATLESPTHRFTQTPVDEGLRLDLAPGAWLDRDVVVLVTPSEAQPSLVVQARDAVSTEAPIVAMAAMQLPAGAEREAIAVKLLVDCSGSMAGDSIGSARRALQGVLAGLKVTDQVSLTRFGSQVEHVLKPGSATPARLREALPALEGLAADLGGTEMEAALASTFKLNTGETGVAPDVLLITDGEVWQVDEMIAAARASHHRVFVIGVGSSPAEAVLRSLAEATGGACEFATPGEALEAAAQRMLRRMRQAPLAQVQMDWGAQPVWQATLPLGSFGGDTVIAWAGFASPVTGSAVRMMAAGAGSAYTQLARGEADAPVSGDSLARMAATRRLAQAAPAEAPAMAVSYQLMSPHTNCILVHRRAQADKATEAAELHRVSSMLAAGWGATSSADSSFALMAPVSYSQTPMMAVLACTPVERFSIVNHFDEAAPQVACFKPPGWGRPETAPVTLAALARRVAQALEGGERLEELAHWFDSMELHTDVRQGIAQAAGVVGQAGAAWLLLAYWVTTRAQGLADPTVAGVLQPLVDALDSDARKTCEQLFEQVLGRYPVDGYDDRRHQRMQMAIRQTQP